MAGNGRGGDEKKPAPLNTRDKYITVGNTNRGNGRLVLNPNYVPPPTVKPPVAGATPIFGQVENGRGHLRDDPYKLEGYQKPIDANSYEAFDAAGRSLGVKQVQRGGGGFFGGLVDFFSSSVNNIGSSVGNAVSDVAKGVGNAVSSVTKDVGKAVEGLPKGLETGLSTVGKAVEGLVKDPIKAASDLIYDTGKNTGLNDVARDVGKGLEDLAKDVGKGVEDLGKGLGLSGGGSSAAPAPEAKAPEASPAQGIAETAIAGGEAGAADPTKGGPDIRLRMKQGGGQQQKRRQKFGIGSSKTGVNI